MAHENMLPLFCDIARLSHCRDAVLTCRGACQGSSMAPPRPTSSSRPVWREPLLMLSSVAWVPYRSNAHCPEHHAFPQVNGCICSVALYTCSFPKPSQRLQPAVARVKPRPQALQARPKSKSRTRHAGAPLLRQPSLAPICQLRSLPTAIELLLLLIFLSSKHRSTLSMS
jgi:hypothetical protein